MISKKPAKKSILRRSRKSLTLEPQLLEILTDLKGKLIQKTHHDYSTSTLVNLLTVAGLSSADKLSLRECMAIKSMVKEKRIRISGKTIQNCVSKLSKNS